MLAAGGPESLSGSIAFSAFPIPRPIRHCATSSVDVGRRDSFAALEGHRQMACDESMILVDALGATNTGRKGTATIPSSGESLIESEAWHFFGSIREGLTKRSFPVNVSGHLIGRRAVPPWRIGIRWKSCSLAMSSLTTQNLAYAATQ